MPDLPRVLLGFRERCAIDLSEMVSILDLSSSLRVYSVFLKLAHFVFDRLLSSSKVGPTFLSCSQVGYGDSPPLSTWMSL